ncbi:MAG TPA: FUSC family protein [Acidiphilium sp.]
MAVPVFLAALSGHIGLGLAASVGGLMAIGAETGTAPGERMGSLAALLAPAIAAAAIAALIAGHGWRTDALLTLLAILAAVFGGYSRPLAVATTRFVVFLVIAISVLETAPDRAVLAVLMILGALWTMAVSLLLGALIGSGQNGPAIRPPASSATAAQKFSRWKRNLTHLSGWQFALRLGLCLGIAGVLRWRWPDSHLIWIALTVVLLSQRRLDIVPVKTTQRAVGTTLGVVAADLFTLHGLPVWGVVVTIGVLGAARPWLRSRNYLAYSACMTPLIILILDADGPITGGILGDRLIATLIGVAMVIATNLAFARLVPKTA